MAPLFPFVASHGELPGLSLTLSLLVPSGVSDACVHMRRHTNASNCKVQRWRMLATLSHLSARAWSSQDVKHWT
eukprot:3578334-Alexandrium_andersonii.AAC.1